MTTLSRTEVSELNAALTRLYAITPLETYPARVLAAVQQLIGCTHVSYNEINLAARSYRILVDPPEIVERDVDNAFARYLSQHPVIAHVAATGDTRSHLITDFVTQAEYRKLDLYAECFRPIGTETQLSTTLVAKRGESVIGIALNRGWKGFSERERALLDLLRAHLLVSYDNAYQLTSALRHVRSPDERQAFAAALGRLTDRQTEILQLVAGGQTNAQIAFHLDISPATVKKHLEHIRARLGVMTRTAAAAVYIMATPQSDTRDWIPTIHA